MEDEEPWGHDARFLASLRGRLLVENSRAVQGGVYPTPAAMVKVLVYSRARLIVSPCEQEI